MNTAFAQAAQAFNSKCPHVGEISITTFRDQEDLINALNTIVPNVYGSGEYSEKYSVWKPTLVIPFTKINEVDRPYYNNAKLLCGEKVANLSWLVKIYFPKWEPLASPASGILFISKNKKNHWFVWNIFR